MFLVSIIFSGIIIGFLANRIKKRFPLWVFMLVAFLGALIGGFLSFGDSVFLLAYPIFNIWTVPLSGALLFSAAALFADRGKMLLTIITILIILIAIFGLFYSDSKQSNLAPLFSEELQRAGVERIGHPIEGFTAFMYLEAFPGFEESDFDRVQSFEGIYKLTNGKLEYERTAGSPVTSAEDVISENGYRTLLKNFSKRVSVAITTEADIAIILEKLREGDIEQNSYVHDDFSIWYPEGWYPYENGTGVFFVRDADLKIPQNTDGFALGPFFQVTVHKISADEIFAQNLWNEGSEFLISKESVRIKNNEAIKVITKAAGAEGEVLHYVFESIDGRTFVLSHYPFERGSADTDDFERAVHSFMINYVIDDNTVLSKDEARSIAESSCIKGGESLASDGMYNENSKTWWFDANLNATREGCNPACVVSEQTKTAEVNWRCTGLKEPEVTACAPEQRNADFCTTDYTPVCAKVNIQCITTPCNPVSETFSNACEGCKNPLVESYVTGECKQQGDL